MGGKSHQRSLQDFRNPLETGTVVQTVIQWEGVGVDLQEEQEDLRRR